MATRVEKYKDKAIKASRSSRNQNLYNTMYSSDRYSNIEGVASMSKKNEIDITKVREMLNVKDNYKREYRKPDRQTTEEIPIIRKRYTESESNYDIMDVLKEAREKEEPDNKNRVLDNTNYDILKKLNLEKNKEEKVEEQEDLKELIETISNKNPSKDDDELTFTMFKELTAEDEDSKVSEDEDLKELIPKKEDSMDDSFFTGKIKKSDFSFKEKKDSKVKSFFLVLFVIILLVGAIILALYSFGVFDKLK